MRGPRDYLDGIVRIHRLRDPEEQRSTWRQSLATLAAVVANDRRTVPLEGYPPEQLRRSVATALETHLIDDLDWLSPPAAAAALYELGAALPATSEERREIGRRVLRRLLGGDAATFIALATQLALGSQRSLSGTAVRARVALALDLPFGTGTRADALALALISRRELEREWLTIPSTGALPSRRLAARLLERAAREAVRRTAEGDDSGVHVFETPAVQAAWARLLAERESLVWRHVATARGLLSAVVPALAGEIERDLASHLTPTEWRRAAASLAARIAVDPEAAARHAHGLLMSPVMQRDPGIAAAMIFGLPRAAEAEPGAAGALLEQLARIGGLDAAEALVELRRERLAGELTVSAARIARATLRDARAKATGDDGRIALIDALDDELDEEGAEREPTLRERLSNAIATFASKDANEARLEAGRVLETAEARVTTLEKCSDQDAEGRQRGFRALREIDLALFETDALGDLLALGVRDDLSAPGRPLGDLFDRVADWLVERERTPVPHGTEVPHLTIRLRRLRTMLHMVDADGSYGDDRLSLLRERRLRTTGVLLERAHEDAPSPLRRTVCAAGARACDALVREELAEVSDVLIAVATHLTSEQDLKTIAEASMVPDIEAAVSAYVRLLPAVEGAPLSGRGLRATLDALDRLARELPVATSPRVEALRATLLGLSRALEDVAARGSIAELTEGSEGAPLLPLESAVQSLSRLVSGARRRLALSTDDEAPTSGSAIRLVAVCLERAIGGRRDVLGDAIESAAETLRFELPTVLAEAVTTVLRRIATLPDEAQRRPRSSFLPAPPKEAPLPPWLPPSRTLGGFYVLRPLGAGAVGSVFVATRTETRHDPGAEQFALKVPEYDGTAARTLSEAEFLQLFREEAGALLSLPHHPNLAGFVTFDAGAWPKPILVMELVEGPTLERVLETNEVHIERALEVLVGIADGLETMHRAGIAHLDIKASNVILRDPDGSASPGAPSEPVLVDFGLAGRQVRPGCGTAEYAAPEVWGQPDHGAGPTPTDIYAFACLTYEVLTGRQLIAGPNEIALLTTHLSHDGRPPGVQALLDDSRTAELGALLERGLRRDPAARLPIAAMRDGLAALRGKLAPMPWPISV